MASSLVAYKKISPNKNSPRNHSIDRITPHCYVGQVSVEDMGAWFSKSSAYSSNYGIGQDGRIGMFVSEDDRSWCSSSRENDNRAITIECASDKVDPYAINDKVYASLINLMTDICKRFGKKKLLWFGDKDKTLAYQPASDEMVITVHRWFANKACPGDYIYNRLPTIAATVTARLADAPSDWTQAGGIPKSKEDFIAKVGACAVSLYKKTKILPSVVAGQCCLESGFGLGADAKVLTEVSNILGMVTDLINSTWQQFSTWTGKTITKPTKEWDKALGRYVTVNRPFRAYDNYRQCIEDYEQFLLHVQNNSGYKYRKVAGMTDPREVITIISQGGYATDPIYIDKVMRVINENNLVQYDKLAGVKESDPVSDGWYRVAESYKDGKYTGQKGAFSSKDNAINLAKSTGLKAFDPQGKQIYPETTTALPDRYVVRRRWSEKKYQIGAFSILSNAKKMADENWGYRVYDLQTPKSAIYKPTLNRRQKLCAACVRLNQWLLDDIKAGKDWRYYNSGHVSESTFWKTRKANKLYTNCMGGVAFAMKESGLPASDCSWYGQKGGGIRWLNDHAETDLSRHADIINVQNMTPKQLVANGTLQYGDIVTFVEINHTCIYLGNGISYDSGHAYCAKGDTGEGAKYVKWIGPLSWSSYHVGKIIRLK